MLNRKMDLRMRELEMKIAVLAQSLTDHLAKCSDQYGRLEGTMIRGFDKQDQILAQQTQTLELMRQHAMRAVWGLLVGVCGIVVWMLREKGIL